MKLFKNAKQRFKGNHFFWWCTQIHPCDELMSPINSQVPSLWSNYSILTHLQCYIIAGSLSCRLASKVSQGQELDGCLLKLKCINTIIKHSAWPWVISAFFEPSPRFSTNKRQANTIPSQNTGLKRLWPNQKHKQPCSQAGPTL